MSTSGDVRLGRPSLLRRLVGGAPERGSARSIAVVSGKGGTGKSVLSAALAYREVAGGGRALVFDIDFGVGNAHILQGLVAERTVAHVMLGRCALEQVAAVAPTGVRVIPGGSGVAGLSTPSWLQLRLLARGFPALEERCDLLLLDGPAGVADSAVLLAGCADVVVVVTTPDVTAMTDAYAWIKVSTLRDPDARIGIVVNRARDLAEAEAAAARIRGVAQRFLERDVPCFGFLPDDPAVVESVARRRPFPLTHPESPVTAALEPVARAIEDAAPPTGSYGRRLEQALAAAEGRDTTSTLLPPA